MLTGVWTILLATFIGPHSPEYIRTLLALPPTDPLARPHFAGKYLVSEMDSAELLGLIFLVTICGALILLVLLAKEVFRCVARHINH